MLLKMQVLIYEKPTIIINCTLYPNFGNNHYLPNMRILQQFYGVLYTVEKKH